MESIPDAPEAREAPVNADFTALYDAEIDYVLMTLRRLGVADRDVENVAHELFMTVLAKLDTFDTSRSRRA